MSLHSDFHCIFLYFAFLNLLSALLKYICMYILFRLFKGASVLIIEKGMGEKGEVALALAEVDHLPA